VRFTDACSPTYSVRAAFISFGLPPLPPPPAAFLTARTPPWTHFPMTSLSVEVSTMRLEVSLKRWWQKTQRPRLGLAGLCNDSGSDSSMYVHDIGLACTSLTLVARPTVHTPAIIGFGPPPLRRLSFRPPRHPHTPMDSFSTPSSYQR